MTEINHKALDTIRSLGQASNNDLLYRLVSQYLIDTPVSVNAILDAVEQCDFESIRTKAHTAKSGSAYVGAQAFANRLSQIEQNARELDMDSCKANCDGLLEQFDKVQAELSLIIQEKAA